MVNSTRQERTQYWRDHISKFVASNKTQKQYCSDNNISYTKFKGWRYKFSNEFPANQEHPRAIESKSKTHKVANPTVNKFATVEITDCGASIQDNTQSTKLYLNKHIYLELPYTLEIEDLQKIFSALGVLPC